MNQSEIVYLDYAAATPLDERVLAAMTPYFSDAFYNPSSPYMPAVQVRRDYEAAKDAIARTIGAKGDELVMTAGATESINLAFRASHGHVVVPAIEHHAVLAAAKQHPHTITEVTKQGMVTPASIAAAITDDTTLVSVALANNELGTVQPLRDIAALIRDIRHVRAGQGNHTPLLFHSDASQGVGQIDVHTSRLGVDMLTLNAGKIYGPKQVGLLWAAPSVTMTPEIVGGGQERGLRSGTENVAGVIGFAAAAGFAEAHRRSESQRLAGLRDDLQRQLADALPEAVFSGHQRRRLPGSLHVSFPGIDGERLVFLLEAMNVLVATGSACAANKGTASHVLRAIGLDEALIGGSLRLSLGRSSTETSMRRAAECIVDAVQRERRRMAT